MGGLRSGEGGAGIVEGAVRNELGSMSGLWFGFGILFLRGESAVFDFADHLVDAEEHGVVSPSLPTLTQSHLAAAKSVPEGTFLGIA